MGPIKVPQASPKLYLKKHRMQPKAPSKQARGPTVLPLCSPLLTFSFSSRGGTSRLPRKEARRPRQQEQTATHPQTVRLCDGSHRRDATPRQDQASGHRRLPQGTQVFPPEFWTFPAIREEKGGFFLDLQGLGGAGGGGGGHRLFCCLQDYGKVPTYMQKRAAEERSHLEAYCLQLQEEKEEQIKRRLQKQQDALLVPKHPPGNAANAHGRPCLSLPPLSPAGFTQHLVPDRQRDQSHPSHHGEQLDPVPPATSGGEASVGGEEHRVHQEVPGKTKITDLGTRAPGLGPEGSGKPPRPEGRGTAVRPFTSSCQKPEINIFNDFMLVT